MNKKLTATGIMIVFMIVGFSGCTNDSNNDENQEINIQEAIIGKWEAEYNEKGAGTMHKFTFYDDNTAKYDEGYVFYCEIDEYHIVGNQLDIYYTADKDSSYSNDWHQVWDIEMPDQDTLIFVNCHMSFEYSVDSPCKVEEEPVEFTRIT